MSDRLRTVAVLLGLLSAGCGDGARETLGASAAPPADSVSALAAPVPGAGAVHLVRLVADGDEYAFEPREVEIHPGDVVRFVQTSYQPESVMFRLDSVPAAGAAILRARDADAGPLLTEPGQVYDVVFVEQLPVGAYPFASAAHAVTEGVVRVVAETKR